jgi:hypothetical protein
MEVTYCFRIALFGGIGTFLCHGRGVILSPCRFSLTLSSPYKHLHSIERLILISLISLGGRGGKNSLS